MIYQLTRYTLLSACLLLAACNTTSVRTTGFPPAVQEPELIPEHELMDVGIGIFHPGVDALSGEEDGVFVEVRNAEARFMPFIPSFMLRTMLRPPPQSVKSYTIEGGRIMSW